MEGWEGGGGDRRADIKGDPLLACAGYKHMGEGWIGLRSPGGEGGGAARVGGKTLRDSLLRWNGSAMWYLRLAMGPLP